jgi:ABC-type proline/glycine betaine transport system permease subunit
VSSPEEERAPPGLGDLPRWSLYLSALVFLGALAVPLILANRRIARREKALLCALGIGQTLAALALLVVFALWIAGKVRELAGP